MSSPPYPVEFEYVVLGAGPAGCAAATVLIDRVGADHVAVIGEEPYGAYERPLLSKAVLCDERLRPIPLLGDAVTLSQCGATTMYRTRATHLDPGHRCITLHDGRRVRYGKLLLATGAVPRTLRIHGAHLAGVHVLRSWDHAVAIRNALRGSRRVVVVGGGFIGLETAASARRLGLEVTVLEAAPRLLARSMPEGVATAVLEKFHREGVDVRLSCAIRGFEGTQQVTGVTLVNGTTLACDLVVVGIGIEPSVGYLADSGLPLSNGIDTDEDGRTDDPSIFAAGDVANRRTHAGGQTFSIRLEAWEPAREQGAAVARVMLGDRSPVQRAPWVWSDMFDWNLQSVGHGTLSDSTVTRGNIDEHRFTVFQLSHGCLVGAITVNNGKDMVMARRAVEQGIRPDPAQLAQLDIPLRQALANLGPDAR